MSDDSLANAILRESFRPRSVMQTIQTRPMDEVRRAITTARRFRLDDRMSAFMADLSTVPFRVDNIRRPAVLDSLRNGAKLPFERMWIEFSGRAFRERLLQIALSNEDPWGKPLGPKEDVPVTWGWLLERHPRLDTVITLTEFVDLSNERDDALVVSMTPFVVCWNTVNLPLPYNDANTRWGNFMHGITGYHCPYTAVRWVAQRPLDEKRLVDVVEANGEKWKVHPLIVEMGGLSRYAMALLSCLNDIPVIETQHRMQRGFVARGQYRKYLDHSTITLNVPIKRNMSLLARRLIAQAKRRMHDVRGHWRLYQKDRGVVCLPFLHEWLPDGEDGKRSHCSKCTAHRTWIHEHSRGDGLLGVNTHDYSVTHKGRD